MLLSKIIILHIIHVVPNTDESWLNVAQESPRPLLIVRRVVGSIPALAAM